MRKTIGGRERETGGERNKLAKRRVGGKEADSGERSIWGEREKQTREEARKWTEGKRDGGRERRCREKNGQIEREKERRMEGESERLAEGERDKDVQ